MDATTCKPGEKFTAANWNALILELQRLREEMALVEEQLGAGGGAPAPTGQSQPDQKQDPPPEDEPEEYSEIMEMMGCPKEGHKKQPPETKENSLAGYAAMHAFLGEAIPHYQSKKGSLGLDAEEAENVGKRLEETKKFYERLPMMGGEVFSETRIKIALTGLSYIGKVKSSQQSGFEGGRPTRKGWEHLTEIFTVAGNGKLEPAMADAVKYHDRGTNTAKGGMISWCGIFANFCVKKGGRAGLGAGVSFGALDRKAPHAKAKPGDVVACKQKSHYCIALTDLGPNIWTIDGNVGLNNGEIKTCVRQKSGTYGWYSID